MADKKTDKKTSWLPVYIRGSLLIWFIRQVVGGCRPLAYSEFLNELESGRISMVEVSETDLTGTLAAVPPSGEFRVRAARPPNMNDPRLVQLLTEKEITVRGLPANPASWFDLLAVWVLPIILIFFIFGGLRALGRRI
jgi:ATP-dependent Zn protease